ncbi:MAG: glycosyltransferase [Candidatus Omnitrophota bacterium]
MKIAFIVTEFPALSETFILGQIVGIIRAGHSVEIFAKTGKTRQKEHSDIEKHDLKKYAHYFSKMPANKTIRILKALWLGIINFYKSPAMIIRAFNLNRFKTVRQVYTLIPFLGKNFDVIHCHFGPNGIIGTDLKLLGMKGKIITSFYGYDVSSYVQKKNPYQMLFASGDTFIAISEQMRHTLQNLGCPDERIVKLPLSVRVSDFSFKQRCVPETGPIQILTVARLTEKKGLEYAIRAIALIVKDNPAYKLYYRIAGDGTLRKTLEALIEKLGMKSSIQLLGWKTDEEVRLLYDQAHLFLLPSITAEDGDQEGTPTVLLEAQAEGLPFIATIHAGIPEIVLDGQSGFLVQEKDVDALAEKLNYLIKHPEKWREMGKAGHEFVKNSFDAKIINTQLIEIYEKCLKRS